MNSSGSARLSDEPLAKGNAMMESPTKGFWWVLAVAAGVAAACLCLIAAGLVIASRNLRNPSGVMRTQLNTPMPTPTVFRSATQTAEGIIAADPEGALAGIGDPYYPLMGNGGYDVQHYDLDISVDMSVEEIEAIATIKVRSLRTLDRFFMDFKDLRIDSVEVNSEAAVYSQGGGELMVTPAAVIPDDTDFTVRVKYGGRPAAGTAFSGIDFLEGWNFYPQGVIVAGEPTGAETWFPSNNHPLDKATYAFHITAPKPYIAAANGVLSGTTENGDGTRTYDFSMNNPMASYLATLAIGNFDLLEGTSAGGLPYRNYVDAKIRGKVEEYIDVLPEAMDYFTELFGPYPFETCGVVVHSLEIPFALENQTLIVMGYTFTYEIVVVHETAHQWFGDSVSVAAWKDIWLNEGFASYAEGLWWEHTEGPEGLAEDISRRYRFNADLPESEKILLGDPGPDRLFDPVVYARGALTLHALRLTVGDEVFFRILRTYYETYRDGNAATDDFIAVAEEISGMDLTDFFRDWLYETDLPDIPEMGLYSG
jgi:aminopeptidase N